MHDTLQNTDSQETPAPNPLDLAIAHLRALIERLEARRAEADRVATVPANVPQFEVE